MGEEGKKYRMEHDSIGEKEVPKDAYYGVQTLRAYENFYITGLKMHPELINSVAQIKKAAAITNFEVGELDKKRAVYRGSDSGRGRDFPEHECQ